MGKSGEMATITGPEKGSDHECLFLLAEVKQKPHLRRRLRGLLKRSSKSVKSQLDWVKKQQTLAKLASSDASFSIQQTGNDNIQLHDREKKDSPKHRQSTVSAAYPIAVASHSKTKTDDPHETSYDFQRLVIGDKSELKRKHLFKKQVSQCSQEVSDSFNPTKSVDKTTSCCLNCQLKPCGNGELYEMTMQLERMMLGPESKSIEEIEDVLSCSSSHSSRASSRFVGDPWMENNSFKPSTALKNKDGAARYHAALNREIDVSLKQSCVSSQAEERDQESTQGYQDEGKRIIVEFTADYNTMINSNITDGSMDMGSYEYDRLLLTHETRSTDESDQAYEPKYSIRSRTDVSVQHERLLLSHEPRSNDDSDETADKKHSFSKRKVEVSLQQLCHHKIEKLSEVSVYTDDMNFNETIRKTLDLQIQNQEALLFIPKKTNFENSETRENLRPSLVALDPFKIDYASKSHVMERDINCPQLSDLTLSSSVTTYHHDISLAASEDQSDALKGKDTPAIDDAARLLDNYQRSDLRLSGSFQGQNRQESNNELILMNFLPLLSTWSAEDVDLKGVGKMSPTLKSGGGRLRKSVRKLAKQTSSLVSRRNFLK